MCVRVPMCLRNNEHMNAKVYLWAQMHGCAPMKYVNTHIWLCVLIATLTPCSLETTHDLQTQEMSLMSRMLLVHSWPCAW